MDNIIIHGGRRRSPVSINSWDQSNRLSAKCLLRLSAVVAWNGSHLPASDAWDDSGALL